MSLTKMKIQTNCLQILKSFHLKMQNFASKNHLRKLKSHLKMEIQKIKIQWEVTHMISKYQIHVVTWNWFPMIHGHQTQRKKSPILNRTLLEALPIKWQSRTVIQMPHCMSYRVQTIQLQGTSISSMCLCVTYRYRVQRPFIFVGSTHSNKQPYRN